MITQRIKNVARNVAICASLCSLSGFIVAMEKFVRVESTFKRSKSVAEKNALSILSLHKLGELIIQLTNAEHDVLHDAYYVISTEVYKSMDSFLTASWNAVRTRNIDPELLIDKDAVIAKIEENSPTAWTPRDQIFVNFHYAYQLITEFINNLNHPKSTLTDEQKRVCQQNLAAIVSYYERYVNWVIELAHRIINGSDKKAYPSLMQHLEIKAIVVGDVFKKGIYWRISQARARHLLSIDTRGNRTEKTVSGNHYVNYLPEGEINLAKAFFKSDGCPNLKPGQEAKTYETYKLFDIHIVTSGFIALTNILVNSSLQKVPYFIQLSNAIAGTNAQHFFEKDTELPVLDEDLFTGQAIGVFLTDPVDGKAENLMYNTAIKGFIGIDNDEVFKPILNNDGTIALKSILLTLPQMHKNIRLQVRDPFLREPELIILTLSEAIEKRNKKYNEMFAHLAFLTTEISHSEFQKRFSLPISFASEDKEALGAKLGIIRSHLLNKRPGTTCQTIFESIYPVIAQRYGKLKEEFKTPDLIIDALFNGKKKSVPALYIDKNDLNGYTVATTSNIELVPFQERVIANWFDRWHSGSFVPTLVIQDIKTLRKLKDRLFANPVQGLLFVLRCNSQFARLRQDDEFNKKSIEKWKKLREEILDCFPAVRASYEVIDGGALPNNGTVADWSALISGLDFSGLSTQEQEVFLNITVQIKGQTRLSLKKCALVDTDWFKRIDLSALRSLSLIDCDNVTPQTLVYILREAPLLEELCVRNKLIQHLDYQPAKSPSEKKNVMLKSVRACAGGSELSLSKVTVREQDLYLIALLAQQNPQLRCINLFQVPLTANEVSVLASIPSLEDVTVEEGNLTDGLLKLFLKNNRGIKRFNLPKNPLTMDGILEFRDYPVKELCFYKIDLGDNVAIFLSAHKTLEFLDLRDSNVTNAGAKALAKNNTIKKLHLRYNKIGNDGGKWFLENTTLTDLDLGKQTPLNVQPINFETEDLISKQIRLNKSKSESKK